MKGKFGNPAFLCLLLIVLTTIIRLIIAGTTGLGTGEAYYAKGSVQLHLSYFDQPPLFLWLSGLSIRILGLSNFALRLPAVLLFAGTTWLLFLIGKRLFNSRAGFYAALIMNLSFVFTVPVAAWYQPDAPLMFFWLLTVYFIIHLLFPAENREIQTSGSYLSTYFLWVLAGISLGLTFLSKYHAVFIPAGVFLFILFSKEYRFLLRHPGPYIALLILCIFSLPVVIWNMENHWISFLFQGSRAGSREFSIHPEWFLRSIFGQALWLAPWIWIPLIREFFVALKKGKQEPAYGFIFWMALLPITVFTLVTLWSNTQYHFHWQAPGYMMLFLPLGATVAIKMSDYQVKRKRVKRWLFISSALTVLFSCVLLIHTETGFWQSYGPGWIVKSFGGEHDPTIEGYDYDDIARRFEKEGWKENKDIFLGSVRWWQAGKIDWALKGQKPMVIFSPDPRNHAFFIKPTELLGKDAVVICQNNEKDIDANVRPFFDSVERMRDIEIRRNEITELTLQVYYCRNFQKPGTPMEELPLYRQLTGRHPFGIPDD